MRRHFNHSERERYHHGLSDHPVYPIWQAMRRRCNNPDDPGYPRYGGRGIKVCARWDRFELFLEDIGERPPGGTLDRWPNNDGDYEPGNVRWATVLEQSRNRRSSRLTLDGAQEVLGRLEHGESERSVARRMGISRWSVQSIRAGISWKELDRPWLTKGE